MTTGSFKEGYWKIQSLRDRAAARGMKTEEKSLSGSVAVDGNQTIASS
jgi:hypothetical protein